MSIEIKVPVLPESVADATVAAWHKAAGDRVRRGENLVDLETDKVVLEVPAPQDGVLEHIEQPVGATVTAGQVLGRLAAADGAEAPAASAASAEPAPEPAALAAAADKEGKGEPALSPAVRKLLAEHDLDPSEIQGSGKGGRILKEDVLRHLEARKQAAARPEPAPQPAAEAAPAARAETAADGRPERRVPMSRLRARIAERLLEAQANAAILTTFNEVNMQAVMDLRARYREAFEKQHGIKLGFMSFFVKAATEALRRFPEVNASIDGNDIVYHGYYDIGVAVSAPRGLVVPVLRDTDQMSLAEIEKAIDTFAAKARENALTLDELSGGTFTISNGGVFGSLMSTPIINPPQSAILGMHKIQQRPVVEDGQIVIRPMMYLALSYDHRLIDGREAVSFLVTIKNLLEDPARMLLEL